MEFQLEKRDNSQQALLFSIKRVEYEQELTKELQKLKAKVSVPGFRKGKVPLNMVKQKYLANASADVVDNFVKDAYKDALEKKKFSPISTPEVKVKNVEQDDTDINIELVYDIYPKFDLSDYSQIKADKYTCEVTLDDAKKLLDQLCEQHGELKEVERKAEMNDVVSFVEDVKGDEKQEPIQIQLKEEFLNENAGLKNFIGAAKGDTISYTIDTKDENDEKKKLPKM